MLLDLLETRHVAKELGQGEVMITVLEGWLYRSYDCCPVMILHMKGWNDHCCELEDLNMKNYAGHLFRFLLTED